MSKRAFGRLAVTALLLLTPACRAAGPGANPPPEDGQKAPISFEQCAHDVVVVVDQSESMKDTDPLGMSIEGAQVLLALAPWDYSFSVVRFWDTAELAVPPQVLKTHDDRRQLSAALKRLAQRKPRGQTSYDAAFEEAVRIVGERKVPASVVFLTDGEHNVRWRVPWQTSLADIVASGERHQVEKKVIPIDVSPARSGDRAKEAAERLNEMARAGRGYLFRLQPEGSKAVDHLTLLKAFQYIAADAGELFETPPRNRVGIFPGMETLLVMAEGGNFHGISADGASLSLEPSANLYRYTSERNRIDVLNIRNPQAGTWQFDLARDGRLILVLAEPKLKMAVALSPDQEEYHSGETIDVRLDVERQDGKPLDPKLVECMSAATITSLLDVGPPPSPNALAIVSRSAERVTFAGPLLLPTVPASQSAARCAIEGRLQLQIGDNPPWVLAHRREVGITPPTGVVRFEPAAMTTKSYERVVTLTTKLSYLKVRPNTKLSMRVVAESGGLQGASWRLVSPAEELVCRESDGSQEVRVEVTAPEGEIGLAKARIEVLCDPPIAEGSAGELTVDFRRIVVRPRLPEEIDVLRGGPPLKLDGEVEFVEGEGPIEVKLSWRPDGEWPATVQVTPAAITLQSEPRGTSFALTSEGDWPLTWPGDALTAPQIFRGSISMTRAGGLLTETPFRVIIPPLVQFGSDRLRAEVMRGQKGGTETARLTVQSAVPITLAARVHEIRERGAEDGSLLSLYSQVLVRWNGGEPVLAGDFNRMIGREQRCNAGKTEFSLQLEVDLSALQQHEGESELAAGIYGGLVTFELTGPNSAQLWTFDLPVEIVVK
jgi:Mg-chelatase subunit ChlD